MAHGPATEWKKEKSEGFKSRLGLIMFGIYVPVYLGFVLLCCFNPKGVGASVGSLNVAIVFGFGLIILAIVQALIYNSICSRRENKDAAEAKAKGEVS
jgi:uncharacterized membrane protein (DUF485 family)